MHYIDQRFINTFFASCVIAFLIGILPFILYDLSHQFVQTLGLPLWIINRIRLFFGLTLSHNSTTAHAPQAITTIGSQIAGAIFPWSVPVVIVLILLVGIVLVSKKQEISDKKKNLSFVLLILWAGIPLLGYTIHAAPGTAYFPFLFPVFSLLIGFSWYQLQKKLPLATVLFVIICIANAVFTVKSDYFLQTSTKPFNSIPPDNYSIGYTMPLMDEAARFIVSNAHNRSVTLKSAGYIAQFATSLDSYSYLVWWHGGTIVSNSKQIYTIYQKKTEVVAKEPLVFDNGFVFVTKHEAK